MTGGEAVRSPWWETAVIYQVYPRSFQDSDGDGVGDLNGITERVGYLADLGVDAIWLSPVYQSPMVDFGYDITDHTAIDPTFGTMADFDRLVDTVHAAGMRLLMDLVPSHTSAQHPWFVESRSSRTNPKRDWYLWADPAPDGGPPSNWISEFGGSSWEFDATTGQYYNHAHLIEQPDLNWRNPDVAAAVLDIMAFWFDRGVDGFRLDAVDQAVKHPRFADNPPNPDWHKGMSPTTRLLRVNQKDQQPELQQLVGSPMRHLADAYDERVLVSEAYLAFDRMAAYYGPNGDGFHLPFNFHLIDIDWDSRVIADLIEAYEASLPPGGWPTWVLGNHDRHRTASRVGPAQARVAAMLLLTLRGTPTMYYGDELGMRDVPIPPEMVHDPWEHNVPGMGLGRDPERTPMPWTDGPGAGFTTGDPWLPIDASPDLIVANQAADPSSMLSLCRALLRLRRNEPALQRGDYRTVFVSDQALVYERSPVAAQASSRRVTIALNLTGQPATVPTLGETLLSTVADVDAAADTLAPNEGRITTSASARGR